MASIVLYYSRADENYFAGQMKYIDKGNTEIVAEQIAAETGAALFRVEQAVPYAADYRGCVAQARADFQAGARPELAALPGDLSQYDTVYLGYPIYCGTMPMALFTLLERVDTAGKRIRPFCTHEGSGLAQSLRDVRQLCPDAEVGAGLAVLGREAAQAQLAVRAWLDEADAQC